MAAERSGYTAGSAIGGTGGVMVVIAVATVAKGSDIARDGLFWIGVGLAGIGFLIVTITGGRHLLEMFSGSGNRDVTVTRVNGYKPRKVPTLAEEPGWLSVNDPLTPLNTPLIVPSDNSKREIYTNLLHEGDALLRNLEHATEKASQRGLSENDLNQRLQWVNTYTMESLMWVAKAQRDMAQASGGEVDVALFATNPTARTKPKYIENEPEMGVWIHMAGRVDWLREELKRN